MRNPAVLIQDADASLRPPELMFQNNTNIWLPMKKRTKRPHHADAVKIATRKIKIQLRGKSDTHKSVAKELYRDKTPNGSKLKQCKKKKQVRNSHQEHTRTTILSTTSSGGSDSMESCRWRDACPANQTI
jgi:hypothetical protein